MFRKDEDDRWDYFHKCTYGYTCDNCRIAQPIAVAVDSLQKVVVV